MSKTPPRPGRITVSLLPEHDSILTAESKKTAIPKSIIIRSVLAEWANRKASARALTGAERKALGQVSA